MRLRFTKMHGQGNDFMVLDAIRQLVALTPRLVHRLAHRQLGVGFDQLLLVEKPDSAEVDFRYRIFNADGGEVEQCGNGARCFARFVRDKGLTTKNEIRVRTASGVIAPAIQADGAVRVDMGRPCFAPADIPFVADREALTYSLELDSGTREIVAISMGNPHAVQFVADIESAPVASEGPQIEHHPRFARRVNAGYAEVVSRGEIALRVWERGAGETLACGTGACAAVVAGIRLGKLDRAVRVRVRGGELSIEWPADDGPVFMRGAATTVFEGEIELEDFK